jgi:hypothetical protein
MAATLHLTFRPPSDQWRPSATVLEMSKELHGRRLETQTECATVAEDLELLRDRWWNEQGAALSDAEIRHGSGTVAACQCRFVHERRATVSRQDEHITENLLTWTYRNDILGTPSCLTSTGS